MKIQPLGNYKLLGTGIQLDENQIYDAIPASNQPDYIRDGKVFAQIARFNGNDEVLLVRGEYKIISSINVQTYEQIVADSTPGRYEGEQAATAYYHEAEQDGGGELVGDYAIFEISSEEREAFSFAESETSFAVLIDNDGFIHGGAVTAAEIEGLRADEQSEDDDDEGSN